MDNLETNVGALGAEDVTSSQAQPTVQETQPVETGETFDGGNQTEAGEAPQYPWQADEKFRDKTPEDIYNAYRNMESQYSRKAEVVNLIEDKFGVTPEQLRAVIAEQEQQAQVQMQQNDPIGYVMQRQEQLEAELAFEKVNKELDSFLSSEEGKAYAPFRDKIFKLGTTSEQDKSWQEISNDWFGSARAQGQQDAYNKIESKKQTQATTSSSQPSRKITIEDMKQMSSAEIKALLQR